MLLLLMLLLLLLLLLYSSPGQQKQGRGKETNESLDFFPSEFDFVKTVFCPHRQTLMPQKESTPPDFTDFVFKPLFGR